MIRDSQSRYSITLAARVVLALVSDARAEGYRGYPCIECDGYDYGWMNAAEAEFTDIDDCDYEVSNDWGRDYVEGCLDYVSWKKKLYR